MVFQNGPFVGLSSDPTASRPITTFSTHAGLWRYTRLNFGISSATKVFQSIVNNAPQGLPGVLNVNDYILVHVPRLEEHMTDLHAVFTRLRARTDASS